MTRYRVIVDRVACIACGAAPATCSEIFELGPDNGKNRIIEKFNVRTDENISIGEIPGELYDCAKTAAEICPVSAIKIEDIKE